MENLEQPAREYLGNCPKCQKHTIVNKNTIRGTHNRTVKPKQTNPLRTTRSLIPKSKMAKCLRCGAIGRITIIGTIGAPASATDQPILDDKGEVDSGLNSYSIRLNFKGKQ